MKKNISILLGILVILSTSTHAIALDQSPEEKAVATWVKMQTAGMDAEILLQTKELKELGFSIMKQSDTVLLQSGCGFAGCSYVYLVTTSYESVGSNTRSEVLAATIRVSTYEEQGRVLKILDRENIENLLK